MTRTCNGVSELSATQTTMSSIRRCRFYGVHKLGLRNLSEIIGLVIGTVSVWYRLVQGMRRYNTETVSITSPTISGKFFRPGLWMPEVEDTIMNNIWPREAA